MAQSLSLALFENYLPLWLSDFCEGPNNLKAMNACRTIRAALTIAESVTALNAQSDGPSLQIKIGLHSGPLIVGNIGARTRMNYTVIGDTVNVCARIEALAGAHAKDRHATVLVSGEVVEAVGEGFVFESIGDQLVKGREQAVTVWRLVRAAA